MAHGNGARAAESAGTELVASLRRLLSARLVETHISWVLLGAERAWKIKKPVRLPFLDFSSLETRRRMCEEELRLNRRLAPSLYLDVVPIGGSPAAPVIGTRPSIEYALVMRRFPDGALLSERLAAADLPPSLVDRLAQRLAAFHRDAPVAAADSPYGRPERIESDMQALIEGLASHGAAQAAAPLRQWAHRQAPNLRACWSQRLREGKVREGHGDLHLANTLVLDGDATAFDCIEFDPALRWIDVQADIAFLVMDLLAHGRSDLAFRFLDRYLAESGDYEGVAVLRYYMVYRALVRAMVTLLRPLPCADAGPEYLALAHRLTLPPSARLLITHGVAGTGKSHAAENLLERCAAIRLRSDVERKRLHGLQALEASTSRLSGGIYSADASRLTYARLRELAAGALRAGWPVIVDAAFLQQPERDAFRKLAQELSVPFAILHCDAPDDVLRARLRQRAAHGSDPSEADVSVLEQQRRSAQPLRDVERAGLIELRGDASSSALEEIAARWLGIG